MIMRVPICLLPAERLQSFQRNSINQGFGRKQGSVVTVVQRLESKSLEAWAERPFNILQFIVVAVIIHLVKCHETGQQEEPLQNAD